MRDKMALRQAVTAALKRDGLILLSKPSRLIGHVSDDIDTESAEMTVLYDHGNEVFFDCYAHAAQVGTAKAVYEAYRSGAAYLSNTKRVQIDDAHHVSLEIARGLADYLGVTDAFEAMASQKARVVRPPRDEGTTSTLTGQNVLPPEFVSRDEPLDQLRRFSQQSDAQDMRHQRRKRRKARAGIIALMVFVLVGLVVLRSSNIPEPPDESAIVTISFNINGADSGLVDPISTRAGEVVSLPDGSELARTGYTFVGWGESRFDTSGHDAYANFATNTDTTLYALWELDGESELTLLTTDKYTSDTGEMVCVLTIENRYQTTVDIHVTYTFLDGAGDVIDTKEAVAWTIGPGERTIVAQYGNQGAADVKCDIEAEEPKYGGLPLSSAITVEERACDADGLSVRLTNTGDMNAHIGHCAAYEKGSDGAFIYAPAPIGEDELMIQPGEAHEITFANDELGTQWDWQAGDYEVCLLGYVG